MKMTRPPLKETDHTNPYTEESFGAAMVYRRGPVVVADGGAAEREEPTADTTDATTSERDHQSTASEGSGTRLADIDHTPPHGKGVARNRIYERGAERSTNA